MPNSKRQSIRFHADENTFIILVLDDGHEIDGLCINEARKGCSGVFVANTLLEKDVKCSLKVGKLDPIQSTIRWVKHLDDEVMKVGFEFDE
jgi:hypothetical protein